MASACVGLHTIYLGMAGELCSIYGDMFSGLNTAQLLEEEVYNGGGNCQRGSNKHNN